jgi:ligand-binding sensor domain-containing protein/two-component sensor histidine kinase
MRGICVLACSLAGASQLPIRVYSTADGLRNNSVNRITSDTRGFLWFSTSDGVARFDGYQFLTFSVDEGLRHRRVNDVMEAGNGRIWIATAGGLCWLGQQPRPGPPIDCGYVPPGARSVFRLLEARSSSTKETVIWCGTEAGLFRFTSRDGRFERMILTSGTSDKEPLVNDLYRDRDGTLWVGTELGLYRYGDGGVAAHYTVQQGLPANQVTAVREDRSGALWATTWRGAARIVNGHVDRVLDRSGGLAGEYLYTLLPLDNGDIWFAGVGGVTVVDAAGVVQRRMAGADGLVVDDVEALAQDAAGNIWVGTDGGGAIKIAQSGFTSYAEPDGILGHPSALFESRSGELVLLTKTDDALRWYVWSGARFRLVRTLSSKRHFGWGAGQVAFQGASGDWWITTTAGLFRFAASPSIAGVETETPVPVAIGPPGAPAPLKIFEDSRGDIWMAFRRPGRLGLARWRRSTGVLEPIVPDGASQMPASFPFVFAEDRSGAVWVGYFQGQLWRYRDGRLNQVAMPSRAGHGIRSLLVDSRGRLWVGTSEAGLFRFDHPEFEQQPVLVSLAAGSRPSGDLIECLTEDGFGQIYACTSSGVDALDSTSSRLRHYTAEDGLVKGDLPMALRDREGALWFASTRGVSRLIPRRDRRLEGPFLQISRLDIAGMPQAISPLGQSRISGLVLPFGAGPMRIEASGISFRPGDVLRYQTKLEGMDRDWSAPSSDRATSYVALQPGSYRFLARAVNADGAVSAVPAEVDFTVLTPFWLRWWFLSLVGIVVTGSVVSLHRIRIARLMEIGRVRNRIAGDLHDDIGATLSQIAILSAVAKRESGAAAQAPLNRISELSSEVLESISDIVWAINPARDRATDLIQRMRHCAADLFTSANIELAFSVESSPAEQPLRPELRRELLLIFKEAAHNVLKHAEAKQVSVRIWAERDTFGFEMTDDGRGFDRGSLSGEGHGLPGIEQRVRALAGESAIVSQPGKGTRVRVKVPIRRHARTYINR